MKASRNKTIDFPLEEGKEYLKKCVYLDSVEKIIENSTVIGDTFLALKKVKDKSIDLLIVDPPYNLNKSFHGNTFSKMQDDEYYVYTEKWIEAVKSKLKDNASLYVCCDWRSGLIIGDILDKKLILRNLFIFSNLSQRVCRSVPRGWQYGFDLRTGP